MVSVDVLNALGRGLVPVPATKGSLGLRSVLGRPDLLLVATGGCVCFSCLGDVSDVDGVAAGLLAAESLAGAKAW